MRIREDIWDPWIVKRYQKTTWQVIGKDCKVIAEFDDKLQAESVRLRNEGSKVVKCITR